MAWSGQGVVHVSSVIDAFSWPSLSCLWVHSSPRHGSHTGPVPRWEYSLLSLSHTHPYARSVMVPWTCLCWVFFIQWQRATFATPVPTRGSYQKACTAHPVPAAASAIQIQLEVDPEGTTLHSMPRLRKVSPGVGQAPGWCHSRAPRRVGLSGDRR